MLAAVFLIPTLMLIWLSRRPRRVNVTVFVAIGVAILSWGVYSMATRRGLLSSVLFIVQGLCFVVFGNEMRRAARSSKSAELEV